VISETIPRGWYGKSQGSKPESDIPQVAATHRVINLNYSIHGVLKQINAI
jgi:hypothetical protein